MFSYENKVPMHHLEGQNNEKILIGINEPEN